MYLYLFALIQGVVLLLLHYLDVHFALQHMDAGVAQILTDKVLQVETFKAKQLAQSAGVETETVNDGTGAGL